MTDREAIERLNDILAKEIATTNNLTKVVQSIDNYHLDPHNG